MNKKEREKFDIHTGKMKINPKEQKKMKEKEKERKRELLKKWIISIVAILIVITIVVGIFAIKASNDKKKLAKVGYPPKVDLPTQAELKEIQNELVVLDTTMGIIKIELYPEAAPLTVNNFRRLVKEGTYNGVIFHRVINDFMIQTGGETVKGPVDISYSFKDEINPKSLGLSDEAIKANENEGYKYDYNLKSISLDYGVVAMANTGKGNTNSSQFFIITDKNNETRLNGKHTAFGKVFSGMDVCNKIQAVPKDANDKPLKNVIINKAYIEKKK
jgi:cyclophilin family peptidyl-prolyl cis-trans isomerase